MPFPRHRPKTVGGLQGDGVGGWARLHYRQMERGPVLTAEERVLVHSIAEEHWGYNRKSIKDRGVNKIQESCDNSGLESSRRTIRRVMTEMN